MQACPLTRWREAHGVSVRALAAAAGCGAPTVWGAEAGGPLTLPARIRRLVAELDGPETADELAAEYGAWRRTVGLALLRGEAV